MVPVERVGSLTAVVIIAGVIGAVVFASLADRMGPAISVADFAVAAIATLGLLTGAFTLLTAGRLQMSSG